MMQAACRFMLEHSAIDYRKMSPNATEFNKVRCVFVHYTPHKLIILQTLAIDAPLSIRCGNCHNETIREGCTYINDLVYLPIVSSCSGRGECSTDTSRMQQAASAIRSLPFRKSSRVVSSVQRKPEDGATSAVGISSWRHASLFVTFPTS